jgi:hypothetical protein
MKNKLGIKYLLLSLFLCFLTAAITGAGVFALTSLYYEREVIPIWNSQNRINAWLLGLTPLGSSIEQVKSVIKANNWKVCYEKRYDESLNKNHVYPPVRGTYAIGIDFGKHPGLIFPHMVDAYWGFNSEDKLIDVQSRAVLDAL